MFSEFPTEIDPVDIIEGVSKEVLHYLELMNVSGSSIISDAQYRILSLINTYAPVSVSRICDFRSVRQNTTSELISRLVRKGFVNKITMPFDRRMVLLEPTEAGKNLLNRNRIKVRENYRRVVSRMTEDELDIFIDSMRTIQGLFEKTSK